MGLGTWGGGTGPHQNLVWAANLTLFQPGEGGQIMPTLYWCPHQVLKAKGAPDVASTSHLQMAMFIMTTRHGKKWSDPYIIFNLAKALRTISLVTREPDPKQAIKML